MPLPSRPEFRIPLIYVAVGVVWIVASDEALHWGNHAPHGEWPDILKGILYVGFTGFLLHSLLKRALRRIADAHRSVLESHDQAIESIVHMLDLRHRETHDHTRRVTRMTLALARCAGIRDATELKHIERGAMLHDIGKIGVPDAILTKNGALTPEEWEIMRRHPEMGRDFLASVEFLAPALDIPYGHHEHWDGSGYPRGLAGRAIPQAARLFAVIDVWDALIHPRVYKPAWDEARVLEYLRQHAGTHFDPEAVQTFIAHYPEIKRAGVSGDRLPAVDHP